MITSLITGGAGFLGSHVAKHCLQSGHRVIILDDLSGGFKINIPEKAIFIKGSINDTELLSEVFEANDIDYVYHLAAYAAEGLSHFIRNYNYSNNLIGSTNLINFSIRYKIKCFLFTSSIAVYGAGQLPMEESMIPRPEDPYGIAKYAVELDLDAANRMFGLNYIIFRPHNVYGENQNIGDRYRNVVGIFMNQIMQHKDLTIFGDGEQTRAFTYIDDVAPVIAASIKFENAYNEVFNIGASTHMSVNHLAALVASAFGVNPIIKYEQARKEVCHAYSNQAKLKKYFGDTPATSIEDGIRKMATWAQLTGIRESNPFPTIEIKEKLPAIWQD